MKKTADAQAASGSRSSGSKTSKNQRRRPSQKRPNMMVLPRRKGTGGTTGWSRHETTPARVALQVAVHRVSLRPANPLAQTRKRSPRPLRPSAAPYLSRPLVRSRRLVFGGVRGGRRKHRPEKRNDRPLAEAVTMARRQNADSDSYAKFYKNGIEDNNVS
jgi:hypothetical protein